MARSLTFLHRRGGRYGIATMCAGLGQGQGARCVR
ncbi:MAG: hypothetical protein H0T10_00885 [Actinobacteria bacterium]|nr:hypothetical protein [Actinomycetota bacterium]